MNEITNSAAAFGLLGILRVYDTQKEEQKSRQEEAFIPFKLPPQAQPSGQHNHPISISDKLPREKSQERNVA